MALHNPDTSQDDPNARVFAEEMRIDHYLKKARFVLAILLFVVGGWAFFTEISGAVIASGKVVVETNSKSVQHLEGGIVRGLHVRDGQRVDKGDVLLTLDQKKAEDQLSGLSAQADAKRQQLALLKNELADLKELERKGLVPRNRVVSTERELAELAGEAGRLSSEMSRVSNDKSRLEVRAPASGRVHKLTVHTVGGVISPGQEILQIVPSNAKLIFQVRINPADIDQVRNGQPVTVKLSSFNQRTTPDIEGSVVHVSPDLENDDRTQSFYYVAHVKPKQGQMERLGGKTLVPGMPADVFIQTDSRTVFDYLMKPLVDQFERAMREE